MQRTTGRCSPVEPKGVLAYYPVAPSPECPSARGKKCEASNRHGTGGNGNRDTGMTTAGKGPTSGCPAPSSRKEMLPAVSAPGSRAQTPPVPSLSFAGESTTSGSPIPASLPAGSAPMDTTSAERGLSFKQELPYLQGCRVTTPRVIYQPPSILQLRNAVAVNVESLADAFNQQLPNITLSTETGEFAFHYQELNTELPEEERIDKLCAPDPMDWDTIARAVQRQPPDPEEAVWENRFWRELRHARELERDQKEQRRQQRQQQRQRKALARASISSTGAGSLPTLGAAAAAAGQSGTPMSRQLSMSSYFGTGTPPAPEWETHGGAPAALLNHRRSLSNSTGGGTVSSAAAGAHARTSAVAPSSRRTLAPPSHSAQQTAKGFLRRARYNEGRYVTPTSGASPSPSATMRGVTPTTTRNTGDHGFRLPVPSVRSEASTWLDLNSTMGSGSNLPSALADGMTPSTPQTNDANTPRIPVKHAAGTTYNSRTITSTTEGVAVPSTAASPPKTQKSMVVTPGRPHGASSCSGNSDAVKSKGASHTLSKASLHPSAATMPGDTTPTKDRYTGAITSVLHSVSSPTAPSPPPPPSVPTSTKVAEESVLRSGESTEARSVVSASIKEEEHSVVPAPSSPHSFNQSMSSQPSLGKATSVTLVVAPEPMPMDSARQRKATSSASVSRTASVTPAASFAAPGHGGQWASGASSQASSPQRPLTSVMRPPLEVPRRGPAVARRIDIVKERPRSPPPPADTTPSATAATPVSAPPLDPQKEPVGSSVRPLTPQQQHLPATPAPRRRMTPVKSMSSPHSAVTHRRENSLYTQNGVIGVKASDSDAEFTPNTTLDPAGGSYNGMTDGSAKDQSLGMNDLSSHNTCSDPNAISITGATAPHAGSNAIVVVRQHEAITPGRRQHRAKGDGTLRIEREVAYGRSQPSSDSRNTAPLSSTRPEPQANTTGRPVPITHARSAARQGKPVCVKTAPAVTTKKELKGTCISGAPGRPDTDAASRPGELQAQQSLSLVDAPVAERLGARQPSVGATEPRVAQAAPREHVASAGAASPAPATSPSLPTIEAAGGEEPHATTVPTRSAHEKSGTDGARQRQDSLEALPDDPPQLPLMSSLQADPEVMAVWHLSRPGSFRATETSSSVVLDNHEPVAPQVKPPPTRRLPRSSKPTSKSQKTSRKAKAKCCAMM